MEVKDINAISVSLDYDKKQSLFIYLDAKGTIIRMGNGRIDNENFNIYSDKTKEPFFNELLNNINDEMLEFTGEYTLDETGTPCELSVMLYSKDDNKRFRFLYGTQFEGLPGEIHNLIIEAIKITDQWYLKK